MIKKTSSTDEDFISLVKLLDADLAIRDGAEHSFYAQYNKIDDIRNVIVCYRKEKPAGCGAFKSYEGKTAEIKRMFVLPEYRRTGVASEVLQALEKWAQDMGFDSCILETGKKQPEAIALYTKSGYEVIENYGQYANAQNSVCMQKRLI